MYCSLYICICDILTIFNVSVGLLLIFGVQKYEAAVKSCRNITDRLYFGLYTVLSVNRSTIAS